MSPTLDRRRALVSLTGLGLGGLITTGSAHAQSTPEGESGPTIVVPVTGRAAAPATHAIGQIVLRAQAQFYPVDDAASQPTATEAEAVVVTQSQLDTLVGMLIAKGLDSEKILTSANEAEFTGGYFGPGTGVIAFQLEGEEIKTLKLLFQTVTAGAGELGLLYDPPCAMYLADSCEDLRADAFADAVERGRDEANLMASALGLQVGDLVRATKQYVSYGPAAYGTYSDSCDDLIDFASAVRSYLPTYDPTLPNEFTVYAQVELVFAAS